MKKGKTIITTLLAIFLIAATTFTLTACGHAHEYDEKWTTDATNHWHVCTGDDCKEVSDKAAHTFVDKNSDTQYWLECSVCGYQQDKITTTLANAEQYANALELKNDQGEYYNNIEILFESGRGSLKTKTYEFKVTETAAYKYTASGTDLETVWTNENGKGVIYTKHDEESEWIKTEQEEEFNDFASLVLAVSPVSNFANYKTSVSFDNKLKYDKDDKVYYGSYQQTSSLKIMVEFRFENGKLVKLSAVNVNLTSDTILFSYRTISYGTATIEIPTITTAE